MPIKRSINCGTIPFHLKSGDLEILLIRSFGKNYWEYPKGHIKRDETLRDCVARETREECGVNVSLIKQLKHIFTLCEDEIKAIILHDYYKIFCRILIKNGFIFI